MPDTPVQLPGFIIAELYKNVLIETGNDDVVQKTISQNVDVQVQHSTPITDSTIKYLGQNGKQVIVVVESTDAAFVNDVALQFLTKLLKACGLHLDDIAIVNTNIQPLTFVALKEELGAKTILLFGIDTADIKLPFDIPLFQVQHYAGCTIVPAPTLADLDNETKEAKQKKRNLWDSLQRCFNLS